MSARHGLSRGRDRGKRVVDGLKPKEFSNYAINTCQPTHMTVVFSQQSSPGHVKVRLSLNESIEQLREEEGPAQFGNGIFPYRVPMLNDHRWRCGLLEMTPGSDSFRLQRNGLVFWGNSVKRPYLQACYLIISNAARHDHPRMLSTDSELICDEASVYWIYHTLLWCNLVRLEDDVLHCRPWLGSARVEIRSGLPVMVSETSTW